MYLFEGGTNTGIGISFQSNGLASSQSGMSSLVTPYGGLEDFGENANNASSQSSSSYAAKRITDFGATLKPKSSNPDFTKDNTDALSTSSSEFSGWKNRQDQPKEDSQSVASLELAKKSSKEGSPAGGDSQSVSSLDLGTNDSGQKSATPQDARSINSLDFKSPDDPTVSYMTLAFLLLPLYLWSV